MFFIFLKYLLYRLIVLQIKDRIFYQLLNQYIAQCNSTHQPCSSNESNKNRTCCHITFVNCCLHPRFIHSVCYAPLNHKKKIPVVFSTLKSYLEITFLVNAYFISSQFMKILTSMLISSSSEESSFLPVLDLKDVGIHLLKTIKKSLKGKEKNKCAILELWFFQTS